MAAATEVEITFSDRDGKTEVVVTHSGWETVGEKAEETRGGYDKGWDYVLGEYVGVKAGSISLQWLPKSC